jgi:adenine C2-methylase RlmN of 23S rRNA A2503 and tRNA A37
MYVTLTSKLDDSKNWVINARGTGYFEARYVNRGGKYFSVYLSSQSGCSQKCRMCHLTSSGQTNYVNAALKDFIKQTERVFEEAALKNDSKEIVHFNFMARGEPLTNPLIVNDSAELFTSLGNLALTKKLHPRFLISTIMPRTLKGTKLIELFPLIQPELYYSIYSMDSRFRAKWLPNALPAEEALDMLVDWQRVSSKIPKLHYAFIAGENDSLKEVRAICRAVNDRNLLANVNIVRYNPPPDEECGEPSEERIELLANEFKCHLPKARVKVVTRIGQDVYASCGMFLRNKNKNNGNQKHN